MIGILIRLPFFLMGVILWTYIGIPLNILNIITIPVGATLRALCSNCFKNNGCSTAKEILSFCILRNGYTKLYSFLKYGL